MIRLVAGHTLATMAGASVAMQKGRSQYTKKKFDNFYTIKARATHQMRDQSFDSARWRCQPATRLSDMQTMILFAVPWQTIR